MPLDPVRLHVATRTRVVALRKGRASIHRDHDGTRAGLISAVDHLLADLGVDWDTEAPVSRGHDIIGVATIEAGQVVEIRRR